MMQPIKTVCTQDDFGEMGWHDAAVHGLGLEPADEWPGRVLLDIDYILEWVSKPQDRYSFWVSPATLVFEFAWNLQLGEISLRHRTFDLSLDEITRSGSPVSGDELWELRGHEFWLQLEAPGFVQYLRRPPILSGTQRLSPADRGGLSFSEAAYA